MLAIFGSVLHLFGAFLGFCWHCRIRSLCSQHTGDWRRRRWRWRRQKNQWETNNRGTIYRFHVYFLYCHVVCWYTVSLDFVTDIVECANQQRLVRNSVSKCARHYGCIKNNPHSLFLSAAVHWERERDRSEAVLQRHKMTSRASARARTTENKKG